MAFPISVLLLFAANMLNKTCNEIQPSVGLTGREVSPLVRVRTKEIKENNITDCNVESILYYKKNEKCNVAGGNIDVCY